TVAGTAVNGTAVSVTALSVAAIIGSSETYVLTQAHEQPQLFDAVDSNENVLLNAHAEKLNILWSRRLNSRWCEATSEGMTKFIY
ncbi:hypothetical protein ABTJ82_19670, partial [Acinetobacter baumannii]